MNMPSLTESSTSSLDGPTGIRAVALNDVGSSLSEIPIEMFCQFLLPRPAVVDHLDAMLADLEQKHGLWDAYDGKYKNGADIHENQVFHSLKMVADAIALVASAYDGGKVPLTRFEQDPTHAPVSDGRTAGVKPDGYFVLREPRCAGPPTHWMDIAATGECMHSDREDRNPEDHSKKVLYNMYHTLREDPRRRFTYGFTIENCTMRIWFGGRTDIFVSTPFNFMTEHAYLVRFLLALTYAEEHELGWDPTIEYFPPAGDKAAFYVYDVHFKNDRGEDELARFKTIKILSNAGAHALRGRGTRVWQVRRLENGEETGDEMVLKDCWVDSDRECEGDIMTAILADAKGTEHETVLKQALLTTAMHGNVQIAGATDATMIDALRKKITESRKWFLFHRTHIQLGKFAALHGKVDSKMPTAGTHSSVYDAITAEPELKPITYSPKTHYRIVFKEPCTPLYAEAHLINVFRVLYNLVEILRSLHAIGWVHRDVSIGNVLLLDGTPLVTKLANFECAKRVGEPTCENHEIRIGTAEFISVEADTLAYCFQPSGDQPCLNRDVNLVTKVLQNFDLLPGDDGSDEETEGPPTSAGKIAKKWFHSPIHDLESAFWLFVYLILYRDIYLLPAQLPSAVDQPKSFPPLTVAANSPEVPLDLKESDQRRRDRITAQYLFCQGLFIDRNERLAFLDVNLLLNDHLANHPLHPALRKTVKLMADDTNASQKTQLGQLLIEARDVMKKFYEELESDVQSLPAKRHQIADRLHFKLQAIFLDAFRCIQAVKNWHVCIRPLSTEYWTCVRRLLGPDKQHTSVMSSQGGTKRKHDVLAIAAEEEDEASGTSAQEPPKKRVGRAAPTHGRGEGGGAVVYPRFFQ